MNRFIRVNTLFLLFLETHLEILFWLPSTIDTSESYIYSLFHGYSFFYFFWKHTGADENENNIQNAAAAASAGFSAGFSAGSTSSAASSTSPASSSSTSAAVSSTSTQQKTSPNGKGSGRVEAIHHVHALVMQEVSVSKYIVLVSTCTMKIFILVTALTVHILTISWNSFFFYFFMKQVLLKHDVQPEAVKELVHEQERHKNLIAQLRSNEQLKLRHVRRIFILNYFFLLLLLQYFKTQKNFIFTLVI